MVNVIEVVGCCKQIAAGLVEKLAETLPEARIVTIAQVVKTQQNVNRLMGKLTLVFLGLLLLAGGAGTATAHVRQRARAAEGDRHPHGTGGHAGAGPAAVPGQGRRAGAGRRDSVATCSAAAWRCGWGRSWRTCRCGRSRCWRCWPPPWRCWWRLLATYLPARGAARLDPCFCLREV